MHWVPRVPEPFARFSARFLYDCLHGALIYTGIVHNLNSFSMSLSQKQFITFLFLNKLHSMETSSLFLACFIYKQFIICSSKLEKLLVNNWTISKQNGKHTTINTALALWVLLETACNNENLSVYHNGISVRLGVMIHQYHRGSVSIPAMCPDF